VLKRRIPRRQLSALHPGVAIAVALVAATTRAKACLNNMIEVSGGEAGKYDEDSIQEIFWRMNYTCIFVQTGTSAFKDPKKP
jgi:hypothetical protein